MSDTIEKMAARITAALVACRDVRSYNHYSEEQWADARMIDTRYDDLKASMSYSDSRRRADTEFVEARIREAMDGWEQHSFAAGVVHERARCIEIAEKVLGEAELIASSKRTWDAKLVARRQGVVEGVQFVLEALKEASGGSA